MPGFGPMFMGTLPLGMREPFLAVAFDHVLDDQPEEEADTRRRDERGEIRP
jgi:hypothetical protein